MHLRSDKYEACSPVVEVSHHHTPATGLSTAPCGGRRAALQQTLTQRKTEVRCAAAESRSVVRVSLSAVVGSPGERAEVRVERERVTCEEAPRSYCTFTVSGR